MGIQLLSPGEVVFDRFRVEEECGGGGQHFGYKATDMEALPYEPWTHQVYLKQYHDLVAGSAEARALATHFQTIRERLGVYRNYIVLPLQVGEVGGSVVGVYPFVGGMTLKQKLNAGLIEDDCIRIATALVKTVRFLHIKEIAHLDLKPGNVVVDVKGGKTYTYLIDLDCARIGNDALRTEVKGTPWYMSPEHYYPERFGTVSTKSDIFTLGIMLYELFFGVHPFGEEDEYADAIACGKLRVPCSNYHDEVVQRVVECLAPESTCRPTAGQVLNKLNDHHPNFVAGSDCERWKPANPRGQGVQSRPRTCVLLEAQGIRTVFKRHYYDTITLDRIELRGAPIVSEQVPRMRLAFDTTGQWLRALESEPQAHLDDAKIPVDAWVRIGCTHSLCIGEGKLELAVVPY